MYTHVTIIFFIITKFEIIYCLQKGKKYKVYVEQGTRLTCYSLITPMASWTLVIISSYDDAIATGTKPLPETMLAV